VDLHKAILDAQVKVHESFTDNLNTAGALDALAALVKATNLYLASRQDQQQQHAAAAEAVGNGVAAGPLGKAQVSPLLLRKSAAFVTRILSVMGIVQVGDDAGLIPLRCLTIAKNGCMFAVKGKFMAILVYGYLLFCHRLATG
jgi:hypothetical protein